MTWTMINESNKLNADKVLYSKQKNEIVQEFNNIKKEVIKIKTMYMLLKLKYYLVLFAETFFTIYVCISCLLHVFILAPSIIGNEC